MPQSSARVITAALFLLLALPALAQAERTMVVLGDSLSAAYGISEDDGWVHLLQQRLQEKNLDWRVVNAATSGDTTDNGLRRIDRVLADQEPDLMILQLGGNDGLRGFPPPQIRQNLAEMIERSQAAGARVLLLGIDIPPNYGSRYREQFTRQYHDLAEEYDVALLPFMLEDVYDRDGMMQDDDIHPTAQAQPDIMENVWGALEPLLDE